VVIGEIASDKSGSVALQSPLSGKANPTVRVMRAVRTRPAASGLHPQFTQPPR